MAGPVASEYLIIRADSSQVMTELRKLEAAATASGSRVEASLAQRFAKAGQKMTSVGRTMTRNVSLPIAAVGAASVKMALDFESSMTNIRALVGASDSQMKQYRETIMAMAGEVGKGPKELADALYFITSSGFEGAEALDVLEVSAKASASGLGETQVVADAVTSAVNSYGEANLTAAQAADVLTASVREGKGEPEELAAAIGRVLPVAAEMGVEFEEVGGALASLTLGGLDAAEATTAFRGVLTSLLDPTDKAKETMAELGYTSEELRSMLEDDFIGTLMTLRDATDGDTEAMGALFGNVRALVGQLSLTGANADKAAGIMDRLANSAGTVDEAFGEMQTDPAQQLRESWAELQVELIGVGNAIIPVLTDIVGAVADVAGAFGNLPDPVKTSIIALLGIAAVTGPILTVAGNISKLIGSVVTLRSQLQALQAAQVAGNFAAALGGSASQAATGVGALITKLGPFARGVGIATAATIALNDAWDYFQKFQEGGWEAVGDKGLDRLAKGAEAVAANVGVAGGAAKTATPEMTIFRDTVRGVAEEVAGMLNVLDAESQVTGVASGAVEGLIGSLDGLTGAHEEAADAARDQQLAELSLVDGFVGVQASMMSAAESTRNLKAARKALAKAEADAGKGSTEYKEALAALQAAQLDAITSHVDAKQAVKEYAQELKDSGNTNAQVEARVRKFGQAAGLTKGEIDKLIDSVRDHTNTLKGVPKNVDTKVTANTADAKAKVQDLATRIANLPDRKLITLEVITTGKGGSLLGRASGGPVEANQPYIVGERGPELVVPRAPGVVIPAHRTAAMLRGSDGGGLNMNGLRIAGRLTLNDGRTADIDGRIVGHMSADEARFARHEAVRGR